MVCLLSAFRRQSHAIGRRSDVFLPDERESGRFCLHQDATLPLSSITFGLFDLLPGIGELLVFFAQLQRVFGSRRCAGQWTLFPQL
jgi:hypothetical protein